MKRVLSLVMTALMLVSALSLHAFSASALDATGKLGKNITYDYNSETGEVYIHGSGEMYSSEGEYEYYSPFQEETGIKHVIIDEGITTLSDGLFKDCTSLISVGLPDSLKLIDYDAFYNCRSLMGIVIPKGVTQLSSSAFSECVSLTTIKVDSANPKYDSRNDCNGIIETEKNLLVKGCNNTTIPNEITEIGFMAFADCEELTSMTVPDSVKIIGYEAFIGCVRLETINLPSTLDLIDGYAFENTAFYNDASNWEDGVLYLDNYLIKAKSINGAYEVKDGTRLIASNAFAGTSITEITFPNSIKGVGGEAFYYCDDLERVNISSLEAWCNIDFDDSYHEGVSTANPVACSEKLYVNGKLLTSLEIPDGVTKIGNWAFAGLKITSVKFNDELTSIGNNAFYECSSLSSINLPSGIKSIGREAFCYISSKFTTITLPSSVTNIGAFAFYNVRKVKISSMKAFCNITFGGYAFDGIGGNYTLYLNGNQVKEAKIPSSITRIKNYAFADSSITSVSIPTSVTSIGKYAFCSSALSSITIPKSVTSVDATALSTRKLKSIKVDSANTKYSSKDGVLFSKKKSNLILYPYGKSSTSYTIPSSVSKVCSYAFSETSNLLKLTVPTSVNTFDHRAFDYTSSVRTVYYKGKMSSWNKIDIRVDDFDHESDGDTWWYENEVLLHQINIVATDKYICRTHELTSGVVKKQPTFKATGYKLCSCTICKKKNIKVTLKKLGSPTLSSVSAKSKGFKANWNSVKNIGGYQIQYSVYSKFKNAKTVTVSGYKSTAKTVSKLKANKKYFVRIRGYKKIGSKKYYSNWSGSKAVTTKS